MKVRISELIMEVTRRCNMSCAHCLRGDAQNIDMKKDVVDGILSQINSIGTLTFTGGEPTLNTSIIKYIVDSIIEKEIDVESVYVATNGVLVSTELTMTLLNLYNYMRHSNGIEPELFSLDVSTDIYHDNEYVTDYGIYEGLKFFNLRKNNYSDETRIINMGKAYDNGIGGKNYAQPNYDVELNDYNDEISFEGEFYVNALGNIIVGCDFSFYDQDDFIEFTVFDNLKEKLIGKLPKVA